MNNNKRKKEVSQRIESLLIFKVFFSDSTVYVT